MVVSEKKVYNNSSNSAASIWQYILIFAIINNTPVAIVFLPPKYISQKKSVTLSQLWYFGNDGKIVGFLIQTNHHGITINVGYQFSKKNITI